jgi:hypothetical protein
VFVSLAIATSSGPAAAADVPTVSSGPAAAPVPPPPPYSVPWQLRPAAVVNVVRSDTTVALYKDPKNPDNTGSTVATTLLASYKVTPTLAPLVRIAAVRNEVPGPMLGSGTSFVNPLVGISYGNKFSPSWRYSALLATALPVGMGGDKPAGMDEVAAATAAGIWARSGMDNALFAVNYFVTLGGFDVAYVARKLTIQAEVTALQLFRTRNADIPSGADATRTNFTSGLHIGYFVFSFMSLGGELRHQRWLSTPKAVAANSALRDTTTFAVGPRFHIKLSDKTWLRPGVAYAQAVDDPLAASKYHIVQVDLPVVF